MPVSRLRVSEPQGHFAQLSLQFIARPSPTLQEPRGHILERAFGLIDQVGRVLQQRKHILQLGLCERRDRILQLACNEAVDVVKLCAHSGEASL